MILKVASLLVMTSGIQNSPMTIYSETDCLPPDHDYFTSTEIEGLLLNSLLVNRTKPCR
jgi:hypothetical protein